MAATKVSPEKITRLATGGWACAALGAAVTHGIFTRLDRGPSASAELASELGLSPRGMQALLDGLVGLGLLELAGGKYRNGPEAAEFLVEGKPSYMGGFAKFNLSDLPHWARLAEVARTGTPADDVMLVENPFWEELVLAIAPMSFPMAQDVAARLKLSQAGAISILDVGGGSGVYSAGLLKQNPQATSTQLDWANVNRVARDFVARHGVADRFRTIDGDFHTTDFGAAIYDLGVYSHIAHGEPPEENVVTFRKFRRALKPGGTLVVVDFVQADDRAGPSFALLFHLNMLLHTRGGATYREADYREWLAEAGFTNVDFQTMEGPAAILYAR